MSSSSAASGGSDRRDRICIVGAGPAGLSQARAFLRAGLPFDVIERHGDLGGIWDLANPGTPMYETARFISSKTLSAFFDFPMPGDYPDYPDHRQILAYLQAFARAYGLHDHITFGREVARAVPEGAGWQVTLADGEARRYRALVCANGMTWDPYLPDIPGRFEGELRHAVTYRGAEEFRGKRVLIVGAGNTGCDIACDAAGAADAAFLSLRRGYNFIPKHIFGLPADVFAEAVPKLPVRLRQWGFGLLLRLLVGDLRRCGLPRPDHRIFESHPILNTRVLGHLRRGALTAKPDVRAFEGRRVRFADGSELELDLVLLATGYNKSFPFLDRDCFEWAGNRPKGYLSVFHPRHDNLFTLGFLDTNAGVYEDFDRLAHLVACHLLDQERDPARAARFRRKVEGPPPDLSGGVRYVESPRHASYMHHDSFRAYLTKLVEELGWPELRPGCFEALRGPESALAGAVRNAQDPDLKRAAGGV